MEFSSANTIWVLVASALVFFMQAGFAMVETGFTRAKNAGNIIMKNLMDFCIGTPIYWLVGFGIMFGSGPVIGAYKGIASPENYAVAPAGVPFWAFLIFQTVFCATAATIVSGAMAERTKFSAYCVYSAVISLIIYPIEAHWIWGGGWLSSVLHFHDFAGSTAVHMTGGIAALVGAAILGPRIGKFDKNGKPKAILGHSLTLGALGCFILWFCWFGFNGGSTVAMDTDGAMVSASKIFVTTNLAAAVATCTTMIITWVRYKKPDVSMTLNGSLAGLVAITAGCDTVTPIGAAIIGIVAGAAIVFGVEFVEKVLKVDDPVGAVGVHCVNGALGTLLVGLLSDGSGTGDMKGLFYGGGAKLLGIQTLGVVSVAAFVGVAMTIVFQIIKHTVGLRASAEEELLGMDITEHNLESSYADFMPSVVPHVLGGGKGEESDVPAPKAVPVEVVKRPEIERSSEFKNKYTKLSIICKQNKFEALKTALGDIGVTGLTVTQILGCGKQKGANEMYRGIPVEATLLPKIKVEVVVCKVPVQTVIEAARKALYTGHIGDGKIFVYDVEDVIRVRTGESGYDALQDDIEDC